jgi:alanine dehydrogenase
MNSDFILFLAPQDVRALLTADECIAVVEGAFLLHGEGKTIPPGVLGMHLPHGGFHIKAGALSLAREYFAAKVNANFPNNPTHFGLPTIQGIIVLCNAENGAPLALMDSRDVTSLRTAAATALAAKHLARKDSRVVTICGCGNQGRIQLAALSAIFPIQTVFAFDRNAAQSSEFARELGLKLNLPVTVSNDLSASVRQSDICVTCTTANEALLGPEDVCPGIFIAAVGADSPGKREIEPALMAESKIVCDIIEQCAMMGDLHHALDAGVVSRVDVHAELGEIVAGKKRGRESAEEVIVFDSTGMALQDVAAAAAVYEKAIRQGAGTHLPISD